MSSPAVTSVIDALPAVGLDELDAVAALQTRTDRKYIVTAAQLRSALDAVADRTRTLDIDGRRSFAYESVYFDTIRFDSYLGAARRRPNRFKVRTRTYLDSGRCSVEVKLRDRHQRTVKHRLPHDADCRLELTPTAREFVDGYPMLRPLTDELRPVLTTRYRRSTVLVDDDARATIDFGTTCHERDGGTVTLGDWLIVETKSAGAPSELDRALWAAHLRPQRISKFAVGLAALRPALPSNAWHRVLRRYVSPAPTVARRPIDPPRV